METRYQRVAREQAQRQAARIAAQTKPKRQRHRKVKNPDAWHNDSGPAFFRDPDGLDRDNLGLSDDMREE